MRAVEQLEHCLQLFHIPYILISGSTPEYPGKESRQETRILTYGKYFVLVTTTCILSIRILPLLVQIYSFVCLFYNFVSTFNFVLCLFLYSLKTIMYVCLLSSCEWYILYDLKCCWYSINRLQLCFIQKNWVLISFRFFQPFWK